MRQLLLALTMMVGLIGSSSAVYAQGGVIVNKQALSGEQVRILEYVYGPIRDGAYWYDATSGLWGDEGGPPSGQIAPGLALGGPLRGDASNGHSNVFFNGRELSGDEMSWLRQRYGTVPQGRYWLGANGIGGLEGGAAIFSLVDGGPAQGSATGGGNGGGYSGGIDRGYGGTWGSDGSCFYVSVDGGDVLGPNC